MCEVKEDSFKEGRMVLRLNEISKEAQNSCKNVLHKFIYNTAAKPVVYNLSLK
jgi:hypothetical protein